MFLENVLHPVLKNIEYHGNKNAFCINEKFFTYKHFGENISKVRAALQATVNTTTNVGLVANDDIETYSSIFAIWLEGLAFVPLHPLQPLARSLEIISQADIGLVINSTDDNLFSNVKTIKTAHLFFEKNLLEPKETAEESTAYILFTSGSTGKPKGVPLMRKNVGAFINSFFEAGFSVDNNDRCLQCFDLTFDVSVQCFLTPLTKGACIYTVPHGEIKYSYVYGLMEDQQLTFAVMAPSMIRLLRPYFDEINLPSMRFCILTAEASPVDLIKEWSACIPNAALYNFYGPTESTIYCTYYKFNTTGNNKELNGILAIGKPMTGIKAIITGEENNILATNCKGELCVSGDQLTPGYWKNTEKNKDCFFEIIVNGVAERFYKTGDLCFMDEEGDIMYSGRLDYQVKIQGYRIELGEIEYHARKSINGKNAVAIASNSKLGNTEITLFIEGDNAAAASVVSSYLRAILPFYMLPAKALVLNVFPLNTNGKVDRIALKKLIE